MITFLVRTLFSPDFQTVNSTLCTLSDTLGEIFFRAIGGIIFMRKFMVFWAKKKSQRMTSSVENEQFMNEAKLRRIKNRGNMFCCWALVMKENMTGSLRARHPRQWHESKFIQATKFDKFLNWIRMIIPQRAFLRCSSVFFIRKVQNV